MEDFSDSSFMIAIRTLLEVQKQIEQRDAIERRIRCFFSEENPTTFGTLENAVKNFHRPANGFEVRTYLGKFEDAVSDIQKFIGTSFPLIFIDPTGWTGYPLEKIKPLFERERCEVLINFMFDFVNRFTYRDDKTIIDSLNPILGGPGWRDRLDSSLPRGSAVEKMFRETLKEIGGFKCVVSTKIDRATMDRPHFFITYATKRLEGLKVFRQTEYDALRLHERNRAGAQERLREKRTGMSDLFSGHQASVNESSIDEIVEEQCDLAADALMGVLSVRGNVRFDVVLVELLEAFMLRETNVKNICVALAKAGKIENTWGKGNRKPSNETIIRMIGTSDSAAV